MTPINASSASTSSAPIAADGSLVTLVDAAGTVLPNNYGTADVQFYWNTGYVAGPHMFANSLITMRATRDNTAQEQALAVQAYSNIGFGTNADDINNGKTALCVGMLAEKGSGNVWGAAIDVEIGAGVGAQFAAIVELDFSNNNMDCAPGTTNHAGLFMGGISAFTSTAAIWLGCAPEMTVDMWYYGLFFQGNNLIKQATIRDETQSPTSIQIAGSHSNAGIDTTEMAGATALKIGAQQVIDLGGGFSLLTWQQNADGTCNELMFRFQGNPIATLDKTGKFVTKGGTSKGTPA